jgi:cytochrome P450
MIWIVLTVIYSLAGADTTATVLRTMVLHISTNSRVRRKLLEQIDDADAQGLLSAPVKYEEVRKHIDYLEHITREALRMSEASCK